MLNLRAYTPRSNPINVFSLPFTESPRDLLPAYHHRPCHSSQPMRGPPGVRPSTSSSSSPHSTLPPLPPFQFPNSIPAQWNQTPERPRRWSGRASDISRFLCPIARHRLRYLHRSLSFPHPDDPFAPHPIPYHPSFGKATLGPRVELKENTHRTLHMGYLCCCHLNRI